MPKRSLKLKKNPNSLTDFVFIKLSKKTYKYLIIKNLHLVIISLLTSNRLTNTFKQTDAYINGCLHIQMPTQTDAYTKILLHKETPTQNPESVLLE